jgi:hypothetical protein
MFRRHNFIFLFFWRFMRLFSFIRFISNKRIFLIYLPTLFDIKSLGIGPLFSETGFTLLGLQRILTPFPIFPNLFFLLTHGIQILLLIILFLVFPIKISNDILMLDKIEIDLIFYIFPIGLQLYISTYQQALQWDLLRQTTLKSTIPSLFYLFIYALNDLANDFLSFL